MLERHAKEGARRPDGSTPSPWVNVRHKAVVEKVVQKLLIAAVADPSERVRKAVLEAFLASAALDEHLAQVGAAAGAMPFLTCIIF